MSESDVHSFIIKLWLEKAAGGESPAVWRGHITHVPSGERRYLKDLGGVTAFITPYLEAMGVEVSPCRRALRWLKRAAGHLA